VYFTHSYCIPLNPWTVASCEYGERFSAAIERDNLFGVQFHPEKSGDVGLKLLANFCEL
jgi:glutamine amidotransferase